MGYHRDAKWFPTITPFQAEMRRRTWALVRLSDIIFSHQVSYVKPLLPPTPLPSPPFGGFYGRRGRLRGEQPRLGYSFAHC